MGDEYLLDRISRLAADLKDRDETVIQLSEKIERLNDIIDMLEAGECIHCGGDGEVIALGVNSASLDVPMRPCPECRGGE